MGTGTCVYKEPELVGAAGLLRGEPEPKLEVDSGFKNSTNTK